MTSQPTTSHHKRITPHANASHHFTPDDITSHRSMTWHQMTWQSTKHHITSNVLTWHDMTWHHITLHHMTWHDVSHLLNHGDCVNCRFGLGVKAGAPTFPAALVVPAFSVWELGSRGLIYRWTKKSSVKWFINDSCFATSSNPQHHGISSYSFVQWDRTSRLVTSPLLCKRQVWTIPGRMHENPSSHDTNRRLKTQVGDLRSLKKGDLWENHQWVILVEWDGSCRIWGNWIVGVDDCNLHVDE